MEKFTCAECPVELGSRRALKRHIGSVHVPNAFECAECGKTFPRRDNLERHLHTHSKRPKTDVGEPGPSTRTDVGEPGPSTGNTPAKGGGFVCEHCGVTTRRRQNLRKHQRFHCLVLRGEELQGSSTDDDESDVGTPPEFLTSESAFACRLKTYQLKRKYLHCQLSLDLFFVMIFQNLLGLLESVQKKIPSFKVNLFLECEFINTDGETCLKNLKTVNTPIFRATDLEQYCSDLLDKLIAEKEECDFRGSGWSFVKVSKFEIRINKYKPLKGGAGHIRLPKYFQGCVNVRNRDEFCFKYSILSKFVEHSDPTDPRSYTPELEDKYDWTCVDFPVKLTDIHQFEKRNNISINVFGLDGRNKVFPLKVCNDPLDDHRDLLLLKNRQGRFHYVYVRNFNRMVQRQLTKTKHAICVCKKCFTVFHQKPNTLGLTGEQRLNEHHQYCIGKNPLRLDLPSFPTTSFEHPERSQRVRFTAYADFESVLKPQYRLDDDDEPLPPQNPNLPQHEAITHEHVPYSYCYLIKDSLTGATDIRQYRGPDAAKHFVKSLKDDVLRIGDILYTDRQMTPQLTAQQEIEFNLATRCQRVYCGKGFTDQDTKVRDHQHSHPYNFRGVAHSKCNLRNSELNTLNVYFHNLSYDSHFILKELGYDDEEVSVIASSEEKYISFSKTIRYADAKRGVMRMRFVDSLRFLPASLASLTENLPKDKLRETRKRFPNDVEFNLLTRKGVFPYEYVSSVDKLDDAQLPDKLSFFSKLSLEEISDSDYSHAQSVWQTFQMKTLGEYSDLYNLLDVLLLSDIYEAFRDTCMETHKLDPAHYITLPSYSWDCMLKHTGVALESIRDHEMYLFFEKGIRGGISQCCKRRARANNKHCSDFSPLKRTSYIAYLDANNLYGFSMIQSLPTGGFRWLGRTEIESLDVESVPDDGSVGYVLEVDVEYPDHLHSIHRDLPFLCERKVPPGCKQEKLVTTFHKKTNYIIHYRNLKQALKHGLVVSKTHRVIRFDQSPWLKSYIDLNTELRKKAKNDFEKDLFKLFNNSVFGKFMENLRKRMNFKFVCSGRKLEKLIAKPNFQFATIFAEELAGVHLAKTSIVLEKPIYVGMCILELSKIVMYDFLYDTVLPHYGQENVNLLYMDTDSFVFEIFTKDLYQSFIPLLPHLDTSGYDKENPAYSPANAKVLGKMKDEMNGKYIAEFLGVRTKVYCIISEEEKKEIKKCKGITKAVVSKKLRAQDYRNCILNNLDMYTMNSTFRSHKHNVVTRWENKLTLSGYDGKRHMLNNITTLPHGHHELQTDNDDDEYP